jgi:hypothetical protein
VDARALGVVGSSADHAVGGGEGVRTAGGHDQGETDGDPETTPTSGPPAARALHALLLDPFLVRMLRFLYDVGAIASMLSLSIRKARGRVPSGARTPALLRLRRETANSGLLLANALAFAFGALAVLALGLDAGGYYPRAWEWCSLAALGVAAAVLAVRRRLDVSSREWSLLAALAAFMAWIAVTTAGRRAVATLAVPELQRAGLYLTVLWAAIVLPARRSPRALPAGVLAGIVVVSVWGLAVYLFPNVGRAPDLFEGRHLFQPVGYANAFGILVGMGALLATGLAAAPGRPLARALCVGSLVPLLTALALSSSRGALVAVGLGLAVSIALDPARQRLLAILWLAIPLPLLSVAIALHSRVDDSHVPMTLVARDGHVVAIATAALTLVATAAAFLLLRTGRLTGLSRRMLVVGGVVAATAGIVVALAGASRSLGDRPRYWHAAWLDVVHHPLLGSGAGSFEVAWLRYRTIGDSVLDAHNLYLETLAELGPLGLLLLVIALAIPLSAIPRARPTAPAASICGAYVAFLGHAAVDWDWEMPVVTVTALLCAGALLNAERPIAKPGSTRGMRVALIGAAAVTACFAALTAVALRGSLSLHRAAKDLQSHSWVEAERAARDAARWQPWSAEPYDLLGQAQLARGQKEAAARSFRHALRLDDRRWVTWYELGRIGDGRERQVAFEHILRLDPLAVVVVRR